MHLLQFPRVEPIRPVPRQRRQLRNRHQDGERVSVRHQQQGAPRVLRLRALDETLEPLRHVSDRLAVACDSEALGFRAYIIGPKNSVLSLHALDGVFEPLRHVSDRLTITCNRRVLRFGAYIIRPEPYVLDLHALDKALEPLCHVNDRLPVTCTQCFAK